MTEELLNNIKQAVSETVKVTVNGKIDAVHSKLDKHIEQHTADMIRLEPVIEGVKFINTGRRFLVWIAAPIGILASTWLALKGWFK